MQITRRNPFTGEHHSMDIAVTEQQLQAWKSGQLIQDAMPGLTDDEREFIMTGILPAQWNEIFDRS
jgi:uncharacterized protein (DUF779 family)